MSDSIMQMVDILQLSSGDFYPDLVGDILDCVDLNVTYYQKLYRRMAETGTNKVPVLVENGVLTNGHHRVRIARDLGFTEMSVTDDYYTGSPLNNRII